jgi:hypothetical protein
VQAKPLSSDRAATLASVSSNWRKEAREWRETNHIKPNCAVWTGQKPKPSGMPRGEREVALLDCAWASRLQSKSWPNLEAAKDSFYVDFSASLQRKPWGRFMTLKQCSSIYSFAHDVTLTGAQHFRLMGWPSTVNTSMLQEKDLKSLSGEGFALPCSSLAHIAYYLNPYGDWWGNQHRDS